MTILFLWMQSLEWAHRKYVCGSKMSAIIHKRGNMHKMMHLFSHFYHYLALKKQQIVDNSLWNFFFFACCSSPSSVWSVITVSYFRHLQYVIVGTISCVCLASGGELMQRFYGDWRFKHKLPADSPFSYMISALFKFEAINWIEMLQWYNNTDCDWRYKSSLSIAIEVILLLSFAHTRSFVIMFCVIVLWDANKYTQIDHEALKCWMLVLVWFPH